jgi:hypothetical protein
LTPSGMGDHSLFAPLSGADSSLDVSATRTKPSSLIVSTRAGTIPCELLERALKLFQVGQKLKLGKRVAWALLLPLTRTRACTIKPMKLLLCAILADSLIEIEQGDWRKGDASPTVVDAVLRGSSKSLHKRIGSRKKSVLASKG